MYVLDLNLKKIKYHPNFLNLCSNIITIFLKYRSTTIREMSLKLGQDSNKLNLL